MVKKQTFDTCGAYISPKCFSLEINLQGIVCLSSLIGDPGAAGIGFTILDGNINDYTGGDDF